MQRCIKISKQSVKNFPSFKILNKRTFTFLLPSDIRSEASTAIVKKFDFDFFMIFDSTSLPQSKNVF